MIAGRQTHDYLICVATGRVIEFSSDKLKVLRDEICRQHGYEPLSHRFQIFGLSPEGKKLIQTDPSCRNPPPPPGYKGPVQCNNP